MTQPPLDRKQATPLPRGTYSKIARRLGVTPQHVRLVWLGKVTSGRVSRALDRAASRATPPASA